MIDALPERLTNEGVTDQHKWLRIPDDTIGVYNGWDTFTTAKLRRALEGELERAGQLDFFRQWWPVVPAAIRMQQRGFGRVDWAEHQRVADELASEAAEVERGILAHCKLFDELAEEAERWREEHEQRDWADAMAKNAARKRPKPLTEVRLTRERQREKGYQSRLRKVAERRASFFNKSNDLRAFLFDALGLKPAPPSQREKRTARSVNDSALRYMLDHLRKRDEQWRWLLEDLSHVFRIRKVQQSYLNPPTRNGRLHPSISLYSAETLRWAYKEPALQQWPTRMRRIVRAGPGKVFVAADYSQLEAGILAVLSGDDDELREFLNPGGDLHRAMAMDALGLTREQWEAIEEDRRTAIRNRFKTARYERTYGGKGDKARGKEGCPCRRCRSEEQGTAQTFSMSASEMRAALARWDRLHPKIGEWRNKLVQSVRDSGHSWTSPFGYRRVFCQPIDRAKTEIYNYPLQHCAAMIVNRAVVELDRLGCPLVFQHHDELVAEVPEKEADEWLALLREVMERPVPELSNVSFPTKGRASDTWFGLK